MRWEKRTSALPVCEYSPNRYKLARFIDRVRESANPNGGVHVRRHKLEVQPDSALFGLPTRTDRKKQRVFLRGAGISGDHSMRRFAIGGSCVGHCLHHSVIEDNKALSMRCRAYPMDDLN